MHGQGQVRNHQYEIESSREVIRALTEDKEQLDRRLAQSSLENVQLKKQHDRVVIERDELEEKNKSLLSALNSGEYQRLLKEADRYEKELTDMVAQRDSELGECREKLMRLLSVVSVCQARSKF